jgi:hypothetical protein
VTVKAADYDAHVDRGDARHTGIIRYPINRYFLSEAVAEAFRMPARLQ